LFTVFFGYDATPTLLQLLLYISAIVIAFSLIFVCSTLSKSTRTIVSHKEMV
jgi:high-affinity iron transporter